jgi:hypothetical protein
MHYMRTVATPAARYALLAGLVFWIAISLVPLPRPNPIPAIAAPQDFSAARALERIRAIAQKPHPPGSAEHQRVRDYLIAELTKLGAAPELETGFASITLGKFHGEGNVENIVARLPGSSNTRPVMLAAHYDSVTRGPGASDDGNGVAVLLETLRALRAGPPLRNDVIFLITDGEEKGLLGAQVFMRDHPWRGESGVTQPGVTQPGVTQPDVTQPAVTLNFEARGTAGNAFMFETSAGNEWLIRNLQAAVPRADAMSVAYEIYRRMPNNTDLTIFKRGGLAGMNFAYIGRPELYHTGQDDVAHLDPRSLQEQGRYALSLARRFGNEDLNRKYSGDAVYFPTPFTSLIVYPASWVKPIAWLAAAGLAAALAVGWKRGARGRWMAAPLATVAILQLLLATPAPGVTYLFAWPLLAGVFAFALLMTDPQGIAMGWRLAAMLICPAPVFVLLVPLLSLLIVALGARAAPLLGLDLALMAICVSPQLVLTMRWSVAAAGTPHVMRAIAGACLFLWIACAAFAQGVDAPPAFEVASVKVAARGEPRDILGAVIPLGMRGKSRFQRSGADFIYQRIAEDHHRERVRREALSSFRSGLAGGRRLQHHREASAGCFQGASRVDAAESFGGTFQADDSSREKRASGLHAVVAKNGPKMKVSQADPDAGGTWGAWNRHARWVAPNETMPDFVDFFLSPRMDRPVIDRTGLTGKYDVTIVLGGREHDGADGHCEKYGSGSRGTRSHDFRRRARGAWAQAGAEHEPDGYAGDRSRGENAVGELSGNRVKIQPCFVPSAERNLPENSAGVAARLFMPAAELSRRRPRQCRPWSLPPCPRSPRTGRTRSITKR